MGLENSSPHEESWAARLSLGISIQLSALALLVTFYTQFVFVPSSLKSTFALVRASGRCCEARMVGASNPEPDAERLVRPKRSCAAVRSPADLKA